LTRDVQFAQLGLTFRPGVRAATSWSDVLVSAFAYAFVATLMEAKPQPEKKKGGCHLQAGHLRR
jgi:hypothetical protein